MIVCNARVFPYRCPTFGVWRVPLSQKYTMHQYAKIALDELEEDETIRLHPIEGACVPRDKQTIHLTK